MALVNDLIRQIAGLELLNGTALLGEVIYDRSYAPVPNYSDGSQLLQAAILIPRGVGIVFWDREEFIAMRDSQGPHFDDIQLRFSEFELLGPALRAMLLPPLEPLLDRLVQTASPLNVPRL